LSLMKAESRILKKFFFDSPSPDKQE